MAWSSQADAPPATGASIGGPGTARSIPVLLLTLLLLLLLLLLPLLSTVLMLSRCALLLLLLLRPPPPEMGDGIVRTIGAEATGRTTLHAAAAKPSTAANVEPGSPRYGQ